LDERRRNGMRVRRLGGRILYLTKKNEFKFKRAEWWVAKPTNETVANFRVGFVMFENEE